MSPDSQASWPDRAGVRERCRRGAGGRWAMWVVTAGRRQRSDRRVQQIEKAVQTVEPPWSAVDVRPSGRRSVVGVEPGVGIGCLEGGAGVGAEVLCCGRLPGAVRLDAGQAGVGAHAVEQPDGPAPSLYGRRWRATRPGSPRPPSPPGRRTRPRNHVDPRATQAGSRAAVRLPPRPARDRPGRRPTPCRGPRAAGVPRRRMRTSPGRSRLPAQLSPAADAPGVTAGSV